MYTSKLYIKAANILFYILFGVVLISNYVSILINGSVLNFNTTAIVSIVGALLLVIQISLYLNSCRGINYNIYLLILCILISYVFFWSILNLISDYSKIYEVATIQSFELIVLWLGLIFIGFNLQLKTIDKKFLFFIILLTIFSTIVFSIKSNTVAIYTKLFFDLDDVEVGYQYLSRAALIIFVFYAALVKSPISQNIIMLIGAYILFTIGSRSEFFAFIFAFGLVSIIDLIIHNFSFKKITVFLGSLLFIVIILYNNISIFLETRFSDILNISNSTSWDARAGSQEKAVNQIKDSLLLGYYAGHINEYGIRGYSHNILSSWVNYGLFGFLLYLIINLYVFIYSFFMYWDKKNDKELWLILLLSTITLILIIFSKSIFWPLPALVWGLMLKFQFSLKG